MIDEKLFVRNIRAMTDNDNCGAVSDGDHTFSELYHHRAILTAAAFNAHPEMAWKSKQHYDGSMYDGYFICGVNTVCGQATYHYALEYWDFFKVPELDRAPEWDGHTSAVAAARLAMAFCGAPMAQRAEDVRPGIWELARDFLLLPYVCRAIILNKCGLLTDKNWKKPHEDILQECLDKLEYSGQIASFECLIRKYQKEKDEMTFSDLPKYPLELRDLAEAVEPLHEYMLKYGDPHTKVTVTQYGARLETEGIYIPFVKNGGSDRSVEFEREIKEIVEGVER